MSGTRSGGLPGPGAALSTAAAHAGSAVVDGRWPSPLIALLACVFAVLLIAVLLLIGPRAP